MIANLFKRRSTLDAKVKAALRIFDVPEEIKAREPDSTSLNAISALYQCNPNDIEKIEIYTDYPNTSKVTVKINGKQQIFYEKKSGAPLMEAAGMAVANLLGKYQYHFLTGEKTRTIITKEIPGTPLNRTFKEEDLPIQAIDSYGLSLELANIMGLQDRHGSNVFFDRITNEIINLDFELIFWSPGLKQTHKKIGDYEVEDKNLLYNARIKAREIIRENLGRHAVMIGNIITYALRKQPSAWADMFNNEPIKTMMSYLKSPIKE
jgi:hypothetical protein